MTSRVALVTCTGVPDADRDTRLLIEPLAEHGIEAVPAVWDDPRIDWSSFDLAIVRSCWDYAERRAEFLEWAARVPVLANSHEILSWNTDKRYLAQLGARGVPVIPTTWLQPDDRWRLPTIDACDALCVIKPAISLCALDSGRYDLADPVERRLAKRHVRRLQDAGRRVMIQPYMSRVDSEGETSLVFIAGSFSHAVGKRAVLHGPDQGIDNRFAADGGVSPQPRHPTGPELELAERVLSLSGFSEQVLYARVDLVPGDDGAPVLMELELTEPQLFLGTVPEAIARFAASIATRAGARACV